MVSELATQEPLKDMGNLPATLVNVLQWRALHEPDRVACQFLSADVSDIAKAVQDNYLSYADLDRRATLISKCLQRYLSQHSSPQPILLAYVPGLDFIAGLFGCWYAGAIAVPVRPSKRHQSGERWRHILNDAQAVGVLTTQSLLPQVKDLTADQTTERFFCLATDRFDEQSSSQVLSAPNPSIRNIDAGLALLQYTSGSTSHPKGVMVSHANLMNNLEAIYRRFGHSGDSHGVIWLPPYHDMGLIGGILQPIYGGFPVTLMSPESFLRQPIRWLQAISHFRATTSGGPDFAYEYCLQRTTLEQRKNLDLSSWQLAFTGAEPVRAKTLTDFSNTFAEYGFQAKAFYPCYGLAEATLLVSGGHRGTAANSLSLSRESLNHGNVVEVPVSSEGAVSIVSCGEVDNNTDLVIVNSERSEPCPTDQIGEIWVTGHGIAQGYWQSPEATQESFNAYLSDGRGPYLRTGDLGFYNGQNLYITGRLKDLIVIRGRNHFPQDIEQTVVQSHPDLSQQNAAFSIDIDGQESLVIFQEIKREALRRLDAELIFSAIRAAVSQHHGLHASMIWLLKPSHLPQTTSGKVQRHACKTALRERTITPVAEWSNASGQGRNQQSEGFIHPIIKPSPVQESGSAQNLITWLRGYAAESINSRQMDERRCISPGVILDFGNQGLLGMQVPVAYGGLGLGHQDTLSVLEQLGAIDPTLALFVGLNNVLGIRPILNHGSSDLRAKLLPRLATGRELAAFALTEPGAGSHPFGMTSKATPTANGWTLRGQKIWSGSAAWAGVINVFVKQTDIDGNIVGVSGFAVQKGTSGLRQGPESLTMGMRAMVQNTVSLDDVPVDSSQLLGDSGNGMAVAQDAMMYGRLAIAAASVGGMKRCAQLMMRYSSRRTISTGRLLDNPVTLTRLNWLTNAISTLNGLVTFIARRLDAGLNVPEELYAACKILGPEFYWQAADNLVQCLGGRGYIETNLAPQILRDARVLRIFEGPTESLAMYLGARILHQSSDLQGFFAELNLTSLSDSLLEAVSEILAYYQGPQSPFADEVSARQQANFVAGKLAAWTLAIASLRATAAESAYVNWAQYYFEQTIAQILVANPDEISNSVGIEQQISSYGDSVGNVEQTLAGENHSLDEWLRAESSTGTTSLEERLADSLTASANQNKNTLSHKPLLKQKKAIQQWLTQWLAQKLKLHQSQISLGRALADYGVDSIMAVELAQDLEDFLVLSQPLDVTLAWSFPTIESLSVHLAELSTNYFPKSQDSQKREISHQSIDSLTEQDTDLKNLSETEMANMLAAELAAVRGR
ncbi:MAG: AMP-binding protein [Cyanobacteria bacterium P01_D01_bin.156]